MNAEQHAALALATIPEALFTAVIDAAAQGPLGANPRVGAALLSPLGDILALGHHRGAGTAHAEADAIAQAHSVGHNLSGATCVVSLEPCAHEGRTPSCAKALIAEGVARVLYAVPDPHAAAAGGATLLREAGINVQTWQDFREGAVGRTLTENARSLNTRWFAAKRENRPFVSAKIAHTLDAKVAAANGESQWITGSAARAEGHRMREVVDAIAIGSGTLKADNPRLTARDASGNGAARQPWRVVIGTSPVPADARVRGTDGRFLHLATRDLRTALHELATVHGIEHLLLEGGPTLIGAALADDLVDDLWIHQAPTLLGAGSPSVPPLGLHTLSERRDFEILPHTLHLAGSDLVFHATPAPGTTKGE